MAHITIIYVYVVFIVYYHSCSYWYYVIDGLFYNMTAGFHIKRKEVIKTPRKLKDSLHKTKQIQNTIIL